MTFSVALGGASYLSKDSHQACPNCQAIVYHIEGEIVMSSGTHGSWRCPRCDYTFITPIQSHFDICPYCVNRTALEDSTWTCLMCKGRRWLRI